MASNILLQHASNDLDFLGRLIGQSKSNGAPQLEKPERLTADEYCDVLALAIGFSRSYHQTVSTEFRRAFTASSCSLEQTRQVRAELEHLADRYTAMVESLQRDPDLTTAAARHSELAKMLGKLEQVIADMRRCKSDLTREWPVPNPEEWAALLQGPFKPVDVAFAEMKGISTAELHRKLEEHKAKRKEYGWE